MKQAIALAGGGTKGAYQVGAWKAMRELGIPFDIVTGTSNGSVTASMTLTELSLTSAAAARRAEEPISSTMMMFLSVIGVCLM